MLNILIAAFIYIITPGPVFLSIVSLVAERGRIAGLKLVCGAIFGCMFWLTLTFASLVGADYLPKFVFTILTILCALYLFWLGYKMLRKGQKPNIHTFDKPFKDGLLLGLLNPKSYPVMVAVFSSIIVVDGHGLSWNDFPTFFLTAVLGFITGYLFMIMFSGMSKIRKIYNGKIVIFLNIFGLIYIVFGLRLLYSTFFV